MFPLVKLLKIALPVATVTSATIATTFLVSLSKKDQKKKEKDIDEQLNDFKKPSEDFKDKKMYYSKDSSQKNLVALDQDLPSDLLAELEKRVKDLPSGQDLPQTREDIERLLSSPSASLESVDSIDNARASDIDMPQRGQDNDQDVLQSDAPLDVQKSNQSLNQDLSSQEHGEDDVPKQLVDQELNSKIPEDKESKDVGGDNVNVPQESRQNMSDENSEINASIESLSQSQPVAENSSILDNNESDDPSNKLNSEKVDSENINEGQSVSQEEGELGVNSSAPKGDPQEAGGQVAEENLGDQIGDSGVSQSDLGKINDGSAYGSRDSEDNLGVDSSGGEMTDEKLKELLNIKDQAEDLLGSLGQMLQIS